MESFATLVVCIAQFTIFAKHSILGVSHGRCASGKSLEKLGTLLFISQKTGLQSLQISSTFKLNFTLILLPYSGALLIAN